MTTPPDLNEFLRDVALKMARLMPGCRRVRIKYEAVDGQPGALTVPPAGLAAETPALRANDPDGIKACILKAVEEYAGSEPLTAERLGPLAGYDNSAYFQRVLAKMVRDGELVNKKPGYELPT